MHWILSPEPLHDNSKKILVLFLIEYLLERFIVNRRTLVEKCQVSVEQINWLTAYTAEQRLSPL